MKRKMISLLMALAFCLPVCAGVLSAQAEGCFVINVDELDMTALRSDDYVAQYLSSQAQGIRVQKYISNTSELTARVRLTIQQMDNGVLVYDKNYDYQSGIFDSGDIYLPYVDNRTIPYLVTLYVEDWVYAMPFMQLQPRLMYNGACTYGVRMRDYDPSLTQDWLMGTMVSLDDLRMQGSLSIPIVASNAYVVGQASVTASGDMLSVELAFDTSANVEVESYSIYCITDVTTLQTAEPKAMSQQPYGLGEAIDVSGVDSVLLYIPLTISYDSAGLATLGYDLAGDPALQYQLGLWYANMAGATTTEQPEQEIPVENTVPEIPTDPFVEQPVETMEEEGMVEIVITDEGTQEDNPEEVLP